MATKIYTPLHHTIRTLEQQIEVTEQQLAQALKEAGSEEVTLTINKVREQLEDKSLELEADIEYRMEDLRRLTEREKRLAEEVQLLPNLLAEATRLTREAQGAAQRYGSAFVNFKRIDEDFNIKMKGLVSFSIVSAPRESYEKSVRHKMRLAVLGMVLSLAAAVGAVAGTEFLDQSFTDVETARDFLRLPSLGVIPYIETPGHRRSRKLRYVIITATVVGALVAIMLAVWFVPPVTGLARDLWLVIKDLCKDLA